MYLSIRELTTAVEKRSATELSDPKAGAKATNSAQRRSSMHAVLPFSSTRMHRHSHRDPAVRESVLRRCRVPELFGQGAPERAPTCASADDQSHPRAATGSGEAAQGRACCRRAVAARRAVGGRSGGSTTVRPSRAVVPSHRVRTIGTGDAPATGRCGPCRIGQAAAGPDFGQALWLENVKRAFAA